MKEATALNAAAKTATTAAGPDSPKDPGPKVDKTPAPKIDRARQEQELAFWKQCYAATLTRGGADSDLARMHADQAVVQLRKRIANLAPAGDCVSNPPKQ